MGVLNDDMKHVLEEQRLGFVATVCADGTPNLSPKGTTRVARHDREPPAESRHRDQRRRSALAQGLAFKGTAQILAEGGLFDEILAFYEPTVKGARERIRAVVLVTVQRALPLAPPAYARGMTEDELRQIYFEYWMSLWSPGRSAVTMSDDP